LITPPSPSRMRLRATPHPCKVIRLNLSLILFACVISPLPLTFWRIEIYDIMRDIYSLYRLDDGNLNKTVIKILFSSAASVFKFWSQRVIKKLEKLPAESLTHLFTEGT
jgi:hypothetical protein